MYNWLENAFYPEAKVQNFMLKPLVGEWSLLFQCVITYKK